MPDFFARSGLSDAVNLVLMVAAVVVIGGILLLAARAQKRRAAMTPEERDRADAKMQQW